MTGAPIGADIHAAGTAEEAEAGAVAALPAGSLLYIGDLSITQYDKLGIALAQPIDSPDSIIAHRSTAVRDGRKFCSNHCMLLILAVLRFT